LLPLPEARNLLPKDRSSETIPEEGSSRNGLCGRAFSLIHCLLGADSNSLPFSLLI